jgi:hypothetical protein
MPNRRHIVPNPHGGWVVMADGATRASAHFDTQQQAEARGRQIQRNLGGGASRWASRLTVEGGETQDG